MKRQENPGGGNQILTMLIVVGGGYVLYQYLVSSGMWAQWFGGAASGTAGMPTLQQIAAGIQSGAFVAAGQDAHGNTIVHQVSTGAYYAVNNSSGAVTLAQGPGSTGSTTTVPTTVPVSTTPPPAASNLQAQLQSYANQYLANMQAAGTPVAGLNVNQWLWYYQIIRRGANPANTATFTMYGTQEDEAIVRALGLTDAQQGTIVTLQQFMTALGSAGLSGLGGIVMVPNSGPISNPLPSRVPAQSFNRGFGGYKHGVKGNTYVQ